MLYKKLERVIQCSLIAGMFAASSASKANTLEQMIREAISSHPSVQSQLQLEKAATAGVDSARWQFFPTPSLAMETVDNTNGSNSDYVAVFGLRQPIWTGGKLTSGLDKARANVDKSKASIEEVKQDIALQVVSAYGEWLASYLKGEAWKSSLETHERLKDQVSRRVKNGFSSKSDFSLAQGRYESARADYEEVLVKEKTALSSLYFLLGKEVEAGELKGTGYQSKAVLGDIQYLIKQAEAVNPALKSAMAQVSVANANIDERKADLWPDLYVRFERQFGGASNQSVETDNRIIFGFNSTFGAGLSSFSNVGEARSVHNSAIAEVDSKRRKLSQQVISDHAMAESLDDRIAALKISLDTARGVSDSYRRQFKNGLKTWRDVMNAARDLVQTEVQYADAVASNLVVSWRLSILTEGVDLILRPRDMESPEVLSSDENTYVETASSDNRETDVQIITSANEIVKKPNYIFSGDLPEKTSIENSVETDWIRVSVEAWRKSWADKDIDRYFESYSKDFKNPKFATKETWMAHRKSRIGSRDFINLKLTDMNVRIVNGRGIAKFKQQYRSNVFGDICTKTLVLDQENDQWKIKHEAATDCHEVTRS